MANSVYKGRAPNEAIRYTYKGFKKLKIPTDLFTDLMDEYEACSKEEKWQYGLYTEGFPCVVCMSFLVLEAHDRGAIIEVTADRTHFEPFDKRYQMCFLSAEMEAKASEALRPLAEDWIGGIAELKVGAVYGFRRYLRDSWMPAHVDRKGAPACLSP